MPHLERLIGAYVTYDRDQGRDRLVSDFIAEFDGLSGSAKRTKVLDEAGLRRAHLSDLVINGKFDHDRIAKLLSAMRRISRPVQSPRLGVIGEDHLRERLLAMGVVPESFRYCRKMEKSKNPQAAGNDDKACFLPRRSRLLPPRTVGGRVGFAASSSRRGMYVLVAETADARRPRLVGTDERSMLPRQPGQVV